MPTPDELWFAIEQRTGARVPARVRTFFALWGLVGHWQKAQPGGEEAQRFLRLAIDVINALHGSGLLGTATIADDAESPTGRRDERWDLVRELRGHPDLAEQDSGPGRDWSPVTFTRVIDATSEPALSGQAEWRRAPSHAQGGCRN